MADPSDNAHIDFPLAKRNIIETEVEEMLKNGVIRPSSSERASPVVLVQNGGIRFCVDYTKVSAITVKDSYPLPNIHVFVLNLSLVAQHTAEHCYLHLV